MITFRPFELSLAAALILIILEVVSGAFIFLSFCLGFIAVAAVEALTDKFVLGRDLLLFTAVAILTVVILRVVFRRRGDTKRAQGDVNDY